MPFSDELVEQLRQGVGYLFGRLVCATSLIREIASRTRSVPAIQLAADYLEVAEAKLIDTQQFVEGTLTMFSGFPFGRDHPFTYLEGKRVLELATGHLRQRRDLRDRLKIA